MRISDWSSDVCSSDLPGRSGGAVGEGDDDEVAGPVAFQHGLAAAMDDVAPAVGRQGGIDPLQVLDDGASHPDTVQVGDGIGGHGGILVVSVHRVLSGRRAGWRLERRLRHSARYPPRECTRTVDTIPYTP